MNASKVEARLPSTVNSAPYSASEEGCEFLQKRLALYGKVACIFIASFYILANGSLILAGEISTSGLFLENGNGARLLSMIPWGLLWWTCKGPVKQLGTLRLLEIGAVAIHSVIISIDVWLERHQTPFLMIFGGLLPVTYAAFVRATIIPSSARRTFLISFGCFLPVFVSATVYWSNLESSNWPSGLEPPSSILFLIRGVLTASIAAVASGIIYGLQRQVEKARQLGQYRLENKIGEGGMGEVYKASHAMLRRPTAVKLLHAEIAGEESIARFEREVQLTSQLTHPNTIAIYDYGRTPDGVFYYAMEYLVGMDLDSLVKAHGAQPAKRVIYILRQICGSLSEAHANSLVHRDIKPANIILCQRGLQSDVAKVVDFGLVKDVDASASATLSGANTVTGTPLYMAPEAISSPQSINARSDLYAVGAVGYYLLTGKPLFKSDNLMEICGHQLHTEPQSPSERLGQPVSPDLEAVLIRCLQKDPENRFANAAELEDALTACTASDKWTESDAQTWWEKHGHAQVEPVDLEAPTVISTEHTIGSTHPTMTIDIEQR